MKITVAFLLIFLGGPLVFRLLTRAEPSRGGMRFLAFFTALCAGAGMAMRFGLPELWGQDIPITVASILLIWMGWIGVLAYAAQALRRADQSTGMRRWTGVIGAMGTTVPWFGLAWANLLGG